MAKLPSPSSPSHWETGEAGLAGGGLGPVAQGARAAGILGKRRGKARGLIPLFNFGAWGLQGG